MKQLLIAIGLIMGFHAGAQELQDSLAPYQRFPAVPPFKIMIAPDSTSLTKTDLKKKKPVMIVYFSPDCEHCKHFTKDLLAHHELFNKVQIIMASALNYDIIKKFYQEYKIADYPNIHIGRDGTDFFRTFFAVRSFPTIMLYNKKGNFVKRFDGSVTMEQIAAEL